MNLTEDIQPGTLAPPAGAPAAAPPPPDDPRLVRALEEYSAALKAGQRPNRREYQARYPEVAAALAECLEGLELVRAATPLLRPSAAAQPAAALAGATEFCPEGPLGDYRIVREVGRGGMGVVYEAVQISLGRQVALKVLPFAAALDAKQVQRFKNEAQAAAHLHHTNIVPVYAVGSERGVHYYAMQFIDGHSLAGVIARMRQGPQAEEPTLAYSSRDDGAGPLHPSEQVSELAAAQVTPRPVAGLSTQLPDQSPAFFQTVANLGAQAARALEHAHQLGIVHRDIKPANLLLDGRGNLWVTDFGLAHWQSQAGLTMTGDLLGTLRYMSPEQALARRVVIDHRTDVYSLGATLYELLTLEPVFDGRDRQELLRQIAFEEPKSPRRLNKAVPPELETIVLKALEKTPADRYATALALADDLERFLKDESILAKRPSPLQRAHKWARRHPGVVRTALLGLALLLVTIAVGASLAAWRLNQEQNATRDQLRMKERAQDQAMHRLYDARLAQARAGSLSRRVGQRFDSLDAVAEALKIARASKLGEERLLELRNAAIACLALPDLRIAKEWNGWARGTFRADFDSTLERYARVDTQGVVHIHRVADGAEICRLPGTGPGEASAWFSHDGQFLALQRTGLRLKVWKLAGPEPVVVVEEVNAPGGAAFSPDSRQLAIGHTDGSIRLCELPSGHQLKQLEGVPCARWMVFDPKGQQLAVVCANGVKVYDLETGRVFADLPQPPGTNCPAWHPDGKTLAVAGADRIIHIWDVATRKPITRLEGHKGEGIILNYNHAGALLASTGWDGTLRLWDPLTGQQLFSTPAWVASLRFSPDDRFLAAEVADSKLRIWEVAGPGAYRTLVGDPVIGRMTGCAISPNGRLLALTGETGVSFWDLARRKQIAFAGAGQTRSAVFESSNALLTGGPAGLFRWPVDESVGALELLRIGPPTRLLPFWGELMGSSSDGRVIASPQGTGALVLDKDHPDRPIPLTPHNDVRYTAVSPDGRWAATGSHWYPKVKIWSTRTGTLVTELPEETGSMVGFSPDGRWVATTGGGLSLWEVGSWKRGKQIGGLRFAFSPDSKMLAVETGHGAVRLVDPESGQEYARLEDPNQERAHQICFNSEGTQLVAPSLDSQSVHVWNLRAIREQLAKMGLDWGLPPYAPAPEVDEPRPLEIQVDLGSPAKVAPDEKQMTQQLIDEKRHALEANPNDARACNALAWTYLTAPEALRDWKAALPVAQKAVQLVPDPMYRNTLGLAYYRAGRYRQAVETLQPNLKDQVDWALAYDLYFLAMSHHQLGERTRARGFYDLALRWSVAHHEALNPCVVELSAIQAEASALLGVKEKEH
jgi:serine/threonine protein kinase/WD40 repeat protein